MIKQFHANQARLRRHQRLRRSVAGSQVRPRLNVFRSGQHIYAQIIDDTQGVTLVAASSLDEPIRAFKPASPAAPAAKTKQSKRTEEVVELEAEAAPAKGKGAKKGKQQAAQAPAPLPKAEKRPHQTPVEQLAAIKNNRKVAIAREVGKLIAQRAKEKGVSRVVFDRGGYTYHGRVAALAEGAREVGLEF
jgi:large subunit ribosomal protein L18